MRKRLFCLLLALAALAALLVPCACADDDYHLYFKDTAELKAVCEQSYEDHGHVALCEEMGEFVLEEDVTIPSRLHVQIPRLTIPEGRTLKIESGADVVCSALRVDGTLDNDGFFTNSLYDSRAGITESEAVVGENGRVINRDYMSISCDIDDERFVNTHSLSRSYDAWFRDAESLLRFLERAGNDPDAYYYADLRGSDLSPEGSLHLPERFALSLFGNSLTIREGDTLRVDGSLYLYSAARLLVDGTLALNGTCYVYDTACGVEIREGGRLEGNGVVSNRSGEEYFPVRGVDPSAFHSGELVDPAWETARYILGPAPTPTPAPTPVIVSGPAPALEDISPISNDCRIVILDELGLLSEEEREQLAEEMRPITEYGSVAFWTTDKETYNEVEQARMKRRELFGLNSATILVINMKVRKVSIQSYGRIYETVTVERANTITNNVRNYLTRGEYYDGAAMAFRQIDRILDGGRIPQPMKYLSNASIALILSLMAMLPLAFRYASTFRRADPLALVKIGTLAVTGANLKYRSETRVKQSSDSGGSGCSSCGGGGSSCSSCGGGGSSSF